MPEKMIKVELLAAPQNSEAIVAMAAKLCYSSAEIEDLQQKTLEKDQSKFIQTLIDMGHHSPIEHANFSFGIEGVSRALLAQITRHRLASFSVQSQRYVDQSKDGMNYVTPLSVKRLGQEAVKEYEAQMAQMQEWYEEWCEKLGDDKREDARFVLPNACETRMVMTMNARELLHFFRLRCCERAQWEIRIVAWAMLGQLLRVSPKLFEFGGSACVSGACSEGKMSCKKQNEIRERARNLGIFAKENAKQVDYSRRLEQWAYAQIIAN